MNESLPKIYLARHGETEWSVTGQHTGLTDIPLTARGERNAHGLSARLSGVQFDTVLTSPLRRAHHTCELAGFARLAVVEPDLAEWDYGAYEGKRTDEIQQGRPGWNIFRDGCPDGEPLGTVNERASRIVARCRADGGNLLLFAHKDILRVVAVRWLGLPADHARFLSLSAASLSILGYDHNMSEPVILKWNDCPPADAAG